MGGRDEEDDDSFRYRINLKINSHSGANEAALRLALLNVPGVQDIVFERLAGTFQVYVYGIATQVGASLLDDVQQAINENIAFPLTGYAIAPDLVGISLTTTLKVSSSLAQTDKDIIVSNAAAAAQDYINNLGVGQQLVINEIANRIRNADARLDVGQPNQQNP